jgi:hypothetical protein
LWMLTSLILFRVGTILQTRILSLKRTRSLFMTLKLCPSLITFPLSDQRWLIRASQYQAPALTIWHKETMVVVASQLNS